MGEGIGHVVFLRGIGMVSRADEGIKFWFITSRMYVSLSQYSACRFSLVVI